MPVTLTTVKWILRGTYAATGGTAGLNILFQVSEAMAGGVTDVEYIFSYLGGSIKVIKIRWIVTDNLSNITLEEFDNEWHGAIPGYFELTINEIKEGFCPNRRITPEERGMEDILYWLRHLSAGLADVKQGKEYKVVLLTMNRYKLIMKLDQKLEMLFVNKATNEIKWDEKLELQEFERELFINIEKLLDYIKETNPALLKSKWLEELKYNR